MRTALAYLLVITISLGAAGQAAPKGVQSQVQMFLASHPEVVDQLKELLARQLQQEGSAVEPQAITDAAVAARLQSDAAFRVSALRFLVEQGTITEEQARTLGGQLAEAGGASNGAQPGEAAPEGRTVGPDRAPLSSATKSGATPAAI